MTLLLWIALAFAAAAVSVTLHALRTAKDGIEDEAGFHFVTRDAQAGEAVPALVNTLRPSHS